MLYGALLPALCPRSGLLHAGNRGCHLKRAVQAKMSLRSMQNKGTRYDAQHLRMAYKLIGLQLKGIQFFSPRFAIFVGEACT